MKQSTQAKPFVVNHIQEIRDSFPATYWSYIPSPDNPADLLTRGLSAQQLQTSQLWLHGPTWLPSKTQWPLWSPTKALLLQTGDATDTTASQNNPSQTVIPQKYGIQCIIDASCYSQLNKLSLLLHMSSISVLT